MSDTQIPIDYEIPEDENNISGINVDTSVNTYIHNIYGNFIHGLSDYLRKDLFSRKVEDTIISTYHKAIEHVRQRRRLAHENWTPKFPFLVVDPQLNFEPDPQAGRFFHGYPNFMNYFASKMYNPRIYEDEDMYIAPVLNRFRGNIDVICWLGSVYEAIDFVTHTQQIFGGVGRPIYPDLFEGLIILPDALKDFEFHNPYTEEGFKPNWESAGNKSILIKNLNQTKLCFPVSIMPYLTLESISENSDKFGGASDILSDHQVNFNLTWEASLPTHFVIVTKKLPKPYIQLEFLTETKVNWIKNPIEENDFYKISQEMTSISSNTSDMEGIPQKIDLILKEKMNYIITSQNEIDFNDNKNVEVDLQKTIIDERYISIHGKYGWLIRDYHYKIKDNKIILHGFNLKNLEEDDIITVFLYEEDTYT